MHWGGFFILELLIEKNPPFWYTYMITKQKMKKTAKLLVAFALLIPLSPMSTLALVADPQPEPQELSLPSGMVESLPELPPTPGSLVEEKQECDLLDADGDGFYASNNPELETRCDNTNEIKGYEMQICDCPILEEGQYCATLNKNLSVTDLGQIFDSSQVAKMYGRNLTPRAAEVPYDYIDNNCDGSSADQNGPYIENKKQPVLFFSLIFAIFLLILSPIALIWLVLKKPKPKN